jgi:hypothetical protein
MATLNTLKMVSCGFAALVITSSLSLGFAALTAQPAGGSDPLAGHAATVHPQQRLARISIPAQDAWFGQPSPAVLVD